MANQTDTQKLQTDAAPLPNDNCQSDCQALSALANGFCGFDFVAVQCCPMRLNAAQCCRTIPADRAPVSMLLIESFKSISSMVENMADYRTVATVCTHMCMLQSDSSALSNLATFQVHPIAILRAHCSTLLSQQHDAAPIIRTRPYSVCRSLSAVLCLPNGTSDSQSGSHSQQAHVLSAGAHVTRARTAALCSLCQLAARISGELLRANFKRR